LFVAITVSSGFADEITVRTGPQTVRRLSGSITEYNAETLTIQRPTGREESFPAGDIEHFATTWPREYVEARQKIAAGEHREAITLLREAVAAESRRWAQRQIIADTVRCYLALGDLKRAAATFKVIYSDSSFNRHLVALPIQWWASNPSAEEIATFQGWLKDVPPLKLVAASRLLNSSARRQARQALQDLVIDADPRIATLATCQLWRDQVTTATLETTAAWRKQIAKLNPELRTGPNYLLAMALARNGNTDEATELLLRCPILFGDQSELAAQSLLMSASLLKKKNRPRQAATLYREIVERFPKTTVASQAQQLLKSLNP
jgi:tetratricopeptide (TPR) repeat protein